MGSKERREREKEQLRNNILSAVRRISAQEGWQAVTIRKIADQIEYSVPTIYEHFKNKEEILCELMCEGFRQLWDHMRSAYQKAKSPEEGILAIAKACWEFAWANKELYQVMHGLDGVRFGTEKTPHEAKEAFFFLKEGMGRLFDEKGWNANHLDDKADLLWASLHGLISLTMADRIAGGKARAEHLLNQMIKDFLHIWGS